MKGHHLKKLRIALALLFFIPTTAILLDLTAYMPNWFAEIVLTPQFVPAVIKFISMLGVAFIGFTIVILLTVLFGRIYCSTICPLGILQDLINRLAKGLQRKKKYSHKKARNILRYSVLLASLIPLLFSSLLLINLLDPYSAFGRITVDFFRPVVVQLNNLLVRILESFDIYRVYPIKSVAMRWELYLVPSVTLAAIGIMAFLHGRLYCNTICPVGTLLGLLSRLSLYKIRIKQDTCTACGRCERVCKAECIDNKTKTIDHSRCVACYNCLDVCNFDAIAYTRQNQKAKQPAPAVVGTDNNRRHLFGRALNYCLSLPLLTVITQIGMKNENPSTVNTEANRVPVSPPGSRSHDHFNTSCTACHLCVSACPTHVLQPALLEYGLSGFMQPYMDYKTSFCNYDCTTCSDVCPSNAILPLTTEEKKTKQLGIAQFVKENCIVHTDKTDCGACSEHCPTKAVHMEPYDSYDLFIPVVTEDLCIGCGACEYACPVTPYKAIYVQGSPIHQTARVPEEQEPKKADLKEEFPF